MKRMPQGIIVKVAEVRERVGCTAEGECTPITPTAVKIFFLAAAFQAASSWASHPPPLSAAARPSYG